MFQIDCPWCGPRDQSEFAYAGEGGIKRPEDPSALTDAEWADYLFMRQNPRGRHHEQWRHVHGCGQFFDVVRHTVTYRIESVDLPGQPALANASGEVR